MAYFLSIVKKSEISFINFGININVSSCIFPPHRYKDIEVAMTTY